MKKIHVDVAVIGAGTAGLNARRAAEKAGASVILIAQLPHGTTCARVGCMPSKLLIAASEAAHHVRKAALFGIKASLKINGQKVLRRVQKKRDWFVSFVEEDIQGLVKRKKIIEGHANLVSPHELEVKGAVIHAKSIVFASGVSPRIPVDYDSFQDLILTNETVFEMKRLPKSVLVVGTGIIGLELGQAFHRLGVKVTLLGHKNRIGLLSDPVVLKTAHRVFSAELDLHADHRLEKIERLWKGVKVYFIGREGKKRIDIFEKVLISAGRRPNVDGEALRKFGVKFRENGYPIVDEKTGRAGKTHFFFAGDVTGTRSVLHEAAFEGRMAGANAARYPRPVKKFNRFAPLMIVFTDPQMAVVGMSWKKLDRGRIATGVVDYERQGRSQVMGINQGKVRLYGDRDTGKFVGAEMLGPRVEHTAHLLAWALENEMTVRDMVSLPFYHPVIEEGIQTALEDLYFKIKKSK